MTILETLFNVCILTRCPHCSKCKVTLVAISQNKHRISISLNDFRNASLHRKANHGCQAITNEATTHPLLIQ